MSEPSPVQRFLSELRRRHVPQTAAVYLVAAWAVIEFSDVVVPNLGGPAWIVTTVIVAALLGFPGVLILSWFYDWGADGLTRTGPAAEEEGGPRTTSPWVPALAVLVVGVGSALAVVAVVSPGRGQPDAGEPAAGTVRPELRPPPPPGAPDIGGEVGRAWESLARLESLEALGDLGNLDALGAEARRVARASLEEAGISVTMSEPPGWRIGVGAPAVLAQGETLEVEGTAVDPAGVTAVRVDGREIARSSEPVSSLPFRTTLTGTGDAGARTVTVVVTTGDGDEIRHEYRIQQVPGG